MCGFVGFTGIIDHREDVIRRMSDRIIHRGPDSDGYYISGDNDRDSISLGFRRLSIIDLSDGSQPMYNEDGSVVIVYNGEVYNFMSLRDDLIARGHVFRTRCDTEVILHGYEEWGESLASKLRGMFSFIVWDSKKCMIYGARDPFGIKPLYYSLTSSGHIMFASEIKSFLEHPEFKPEVNPDALRPYLTFQYSSMSETFFKNTYKMPPAHYFTYENGTLSVTRYWDIDFSHKTSLTYSECAALIDARVHESVNAHRISDVKVGSFLSGGVDSSYITATLMPNDTFSVGFNFEKFDETSEAKELSERLGVNNYLKHITADECFDAFPTIQYHMDEPQSNPSSVPLYFLAKLAAQRVTVVLSGEGADEIYAGYEEYDETPLMRKYKRLPSGLRRLAANTAKGLPYFKGHDFLIKCSGRPEDYFIGQAHVYGEDEAAAILKDGYSQGITPKELTAPIYERVKDCDELIKKQYLDMKLWLPGDILLKADKMSMAASLELRVPFLDREVMADAQTIPSRYKITPEATKAVLRAAANKTIPNDWANRPKKGFPVPIKYWFAEDKYYNRTADYFRSDYAGEFFDRDGLMKLLDAHKRGEANNGRKIYTALTFLVWYKRFFIDEAK